MATIKFPKSLGFEAMRHWTLDSAPPPPPPPPPPASESVLEVDGVPILVDGLPVVVTTE